MINIDNTRHTIEKIQRKEKKKEQERKRKNKNKKQIQTNNMVPV